MAQSAPRLRLAAFRPAGNGGGACSRTNKPRTVWACGCERPVRGDGRRIISKVTTGAKTGSTTNIARYLSEWRFSGRSALSLRLARSPRGQRRIYRNGERSDRLARNVTPQFGVLGLMSCPISSLRISLCVNR